MFRKKKNKVKNTHIFDEALVSFRAPEYVHHEKSLTWFVIAGLVVLFMVVYGLKTDGWTFSVAVIVLAGTYYLFQRKSPPLVDVKISKMGVTIGWHVFPYSQLRNFWIVYEPPFVKTLYLRTASKLHPDILVSLEHADPVEVRHVLKSHLDEIKGKHEAFSDTLVRLLKL